MTGPTTVRWDRCVGAFVTAQGQHHLADVTGATVSFSPWYFIEGAHAIEMLHARIDPRLFVSLDDTEEGWLALWRAADADEVDRGRHWRNLVDALGILRLGERTIRVTDAKHDGASGLLILTDQRILHVSQSRPSERRVLWWSLNKVRDVRSRRGPLPGRGDLMFTFDGVHYVRFQGVGPISRLRDLADASRSAAHEAWPSPPPMPSERPRAAMTSGRGLSPVWIVMGAVMASRAVASSTSLGQAGPSSGLGSAGVVAAVLLPVIAIGLVVFLLVRRRRR